MVIHDNPHQVFSEPQQLCLLHGCSCLPFISPSSPTFPLDRFGMMIYTTNIIITVTIIIIAVTTITTWLLMPTF